MEFNLKFIRIDTERWRIIYSSGNYITLELWVNEKFLYEQKGMYIKEIGLVHIPMLEEIFPHKKTFNNSATKTEFMTSDRKFKFEIEDNTFYTITDLSEGGKTVSASIDQIKFALNDTVSYGNFTDSWFKPDHFSWSDFNKIYNEINKAQEVKLLNNIFFNKENK